MLTWFFNPIGYYLIQLTSTTTELLIINLLQASLLKISATIYNQQSYHTLKEPFKKCTEILKIYIKIYSYLSIIPYHFAMN